MFSRLPRYPRATDNRLHSHDKAVLGANRNFLKAALINFAYLQLLFFGLICYIFASLYKQASHIHNFEVLYVDYDGGLIGTAVSQAYKTLQGNGFPSLTEGTVKEYPTFHDVEEVVRSTRYWAAIYTSPGATDALEHALAGGSAAAEYNRSNVMTYIWNEVRYSAVVDSDISANLEALSSAARIEYVSANGVSSMNLLSTTDDAAISVFANPWELTSVNIQTTIQGARLVYNTLVVILILLQEFFYLGTINALYARFKIYERLYPNRIILARNAISVAYTFIGSLSTTGAIWAFRAGWHVNGNQFVLTWMILWLFAHVNFVSLDVITVWIPVQYVPMALVTWIVFNVTSILVPFELSPAFFKWAYVMPAHELYQVLNDIWSGGSNPKLYYALPILFSLEVIGVFLSALGVYRRCHYAVIAEEAQKSSFQERLNSAMDFERKRDAERSELPEVQETPEEVEREEEVERKELGEVIRKEDSRVEKERKANKICSFGPSLDLPFVESKDSQG